MSRFNALLMMGSDQYCLKWNNHWANLISVFNSLLQSETFVDVTLACEGRHLKAHKLVLSACSPYFKDLLVGHPDRHPIVILKDVRFSELRTLIEFIYNGEVSVEQEELSALLCTARELQIKGLADNRLPGAATASVAAAAAAAAVGDIMTNGQHLHPHSHRSHHHQRQHSTSHGPVVGVPASSNSTTCLTTVTSSVGCGSPRKTTLSGTDERLLPGHLPSLKALPLPPSLPPSLQSSLTPSIPPSLPPHQRTIPSHPSSPSFNCSPHAGSQVSTSTSGGPGMYREEHLIAALTGVSTGGNGSSSSNTSLSLNSHKNITTNSSSSPPGSPLHKRRRLSTDTVTTNEGSGDGEDSEGQRNNTTNGNLSRSNNICNNTNGSKVSNGSNSNSSTSNSSTGAENGEGTKAGSSRPTQDVVVKEESNSSDREGEKDSETGSTKKEPTVTISNNLVASSVITTGSRTGSLSPSEEKDTERGPTDLRSPEVIIDECEEGEVGRTPSRPPSSAPSPTISNIPSVASLPGAVPGPLHQQMALLHQLSLSYPPIPGYFPGMAAPPSKDVFQLLEVMKAMGIHRPPPPGATPSLLGSSPVTPTGGSGPPPTASTPPGTSLNLSGTSGSVLGVSGSGGKSNSNSASVGSRDGVITCHICAMIMPSVQLLEEHIRIHEEEKPYKCDQCGQRYKYQSAFQRHQEQNHTAKLPGDKPYRCEVCGQCFKYQKSFVKHRSNHDMLDRIIKSEAEDRFRLPEHFRHNFLNDSPRSESDTSNLKEDAEVADSEDSDRPTTSHMSSFKSVLLASIASQNGEKKEEGEVNEEDEEEMSSLGKFLLCLKCRDVFRDLVSFEEHCKGTSSCSLDTLQETSLKDEASSQPPSATSSPRASPRLSPQVASSHEGQSPLPTSSPVAHPPALLGSSGSGAMASPPIVPSSSPSASVAAAVAAAAVAAAAASSLPQQSTIQAMGDGKGLVDEERPFKCPYCSKGFKGRENLKLHIRTHTGEKPYNCGVCGKAFGGRSDMNRHLRIHTGEKPYPCKVCGKKFARADYLSKHITTHLGIPFAKPVHSLQQSLQNLENMQNMQNLHKLQNLSNE